MFRLRDPEMLDQIRADYFENNGPLSRDFSPSCWNSGMTSPIAIVDQDAFRAFLDGNGITYQELSDSFLLYCSNLQRWPNSTQDSILFKDELVVRPKEANEEDNDPFAFWREVSRFMPPDTFFRVIEIGYIGYNPWVFDRETNYLAMAITVAANGSVIVQDFEDYLVHPVS